MSNKSSNKYSVQITSLWTPHNWIIWMSLRSELKKCVSDCHQKNQKCFCLLDLKILGDLLYFEVGCRTQCLGGFSFFTYCICLLNWLIFSGVHSSPYCCLWCCHGQKVPACQKFRMTQWMTLRSAVLLFHVNDIESS